jgi:mono/diheme cytochrome c family protein
MALARIGRLLCGLLLATAAKASLAAPPTVDEIEFFEKRVRPVLAEHCFECHGGGEKSSKGGLRLDVRDGWALGGDSGPAVLPFKPDESPLIQAVRYQDSALQMPPKGKLPQAAIDDLAAWVLRGAPDPRTEATAVKKTEPKPRSTDHWAYQPLVDRPPPQTVDLAWPLDDLDRFLLAALEAKQLRPAADASPATLVRRLFFDLIGLPPTPEQIEAFVADRSPDAYERLVDRLLCSPEFGQRWARHWLDVVRFGESMTLRGLVFQEAWRYRDYVIDTFNDDRPYDQFVREQVAGDLLPDSSLDERQRHRIATGFLAFGNANLEEQDKAQLRMDVVDEQLDTIGKAFLAQTIGCARCHDHKFDPIPTRDYYALAGILRSTKTLEHANVSNWIEMPLPLSPEEEQAIGRREAAIAALEAAIKTLSGTRRGVAAAKDLPGIVVDDRDAKRVGQWQLSQFNGSYIGDGYLHDLNQEKGLKTLTFLPQLAQAGLYEVRLAYTPASNRATNAPVTVVSADGEKLVRINERVEPPLEGRFVSLGEFHFEVNGQGFVIVANEATDGHVIADAVQFLPVGTDLQRSALADPQSVDPQRAAAELKQLERDLKQLKLAGPTRPKVMTVAEEKEVGDTSVHIRGNVHNMAERVPRGFLGAASNGPSPPIPDHESGRRQLAEWLAQPDNPLTARVLVNRVWHWLFGAGLVRTTDNFGTAGEPPSHPELLDYLARRFIDEGWSIKKLVRRIVVSHAYRLSTAADGPARAADPENRLLAHAPRKRLDAESLRDAMLALSGQLDRTAGGRTITPGVTADYGYQQGGHRRSVYMPVFRNALPDIFQAFDFADPSTVTGVRTQSTTPQQALFFMNHPFVADCSRRAAAMLLAMPGLDDGDRIERSYRQALARRPTASEVSIALRFVESMSSRCAPPLDAWSQYWQALFASLDFRYVD